MSFEVGTMIFDNYLTIIILFETCCKLEVGQWLNSALLFPISQEKNHHILGKYQL